MTDITQSVKDRINIAYAVDDEILAHFLKKVLSKLEEDREFINQTHRASDTRYKVLVERIAYLENQRQGLRQTLRHSKGTVKDLRELVSLQITEINNLKGKTK